jgi:hypothetical protein
LRLVISTFCVLDPRLAMLALAVECVAASLCADKARTQ